MGRELGTAVIMGKQRLLLLYRVMLAVEIIAISFLATTSIQVPVARDINDKINHLAAFYTLALLVDFSWPKSGFLGPKAVSLLGYGLMIEIVQYFLPQRTSSFFDLGADAMGMFLYVISLPLLKKLYPLSTRFKNGEE